jgi:hypothetical protein
MRIFEKNKNLSLGKLLFNRVKRFILIFFVVLFPYFCSGQVLISLLLGDKLNSGKIEFGLEGGANFMTLGGLPQAKSSTGFNLGFYFDIKVKETPWMVHTGVIVKSSLGSEGLPPYSLNDPDLDKFFASGSVERNFRYFNVPLTAKYNFKNHLSLDGGIMLGLLYKAFDKFSADVNGNKLNYQVDILDQYRRLDAGATAALSYKLMKGLGVNFSMRYYYGLADITKSGIQPSQYNRSLYIVVGIPIGRGKALKKEASKN